MKNSAVGISLEALYDEGVRKLAYGGEINKTEFDEDNYGFELIVDGSVACYDGEQCILESENHEYFSLSNKQGEEDVPFKLSKEEFGIAVFA